MFHVFLDLLWIRSCSLFPFPSGLLDEHWCDHKISLISKNIDLTTVLSPQWYFLYWQDGIFTLNQPLCRCFSGCLVTWCGTCAACVYSSDMGESCCLPMCVPGWLIALRTKLRTERGIQVRPILARNINDVTWALWNLKSPATQLFVEKVVQANTKATSKFCPLLWESIAYRKIAIKKGQSHRKHCHVTIS